MSNFIDLDGLAILGLTILALPASLACLAACIIYRRASSSMVLLILAFAADATATAIYGVVGVAARFADVLSPVAEGPIYVAAGLIAFAASVLTAWGLFLVLGDVVRRLDRHRAEAGEPYRWRPRDFEEGADPRWEPQPGGPDIRR